MEESNPIIATLLFLLILSCALLSSSGPLHIDSIAPNFTASYFEFIDQSGAFLTSLNGTFKAAITNPLPERRSYYFVVVHADSHAVVWSANRDVPISDSAKLDLSADGLALSDDSGHPIWSTTPLTSNSKVSSLQLQESGNLVLLDHLNATLWESFDHATDTIVTGQRLPVDGDLSAGDYRFTVTRGDALMRWNGVTYWKLSMEPKAFKDSNLPVAYMEMNNTGLYLFAHNGSTVVIQFQVTSLLSDFRIAKLGHDGRFSIARFTNSNWVEEFRGPTDICRIPFFCRKIGLCSTGICSCPPGFRTDSTGNCTPTDANISLPPLDSSCNGTQLEYSYLGLPIGTDYFGNDFTEPVEDGVNLLACEDLCSRNCSCLAFFHGNSSGSCYLIESNLGSIMQSSTTPSDRLGYIKAIITEKPNAYVKEKNRNFPLAGLVLLPSSGCFLIVMVVGFIWFRRRNKGGHIVSDKLGRGSSNNNNNSSFSSSSAELDIISIPGLPVRFDYQELVAATENFMTQIGSGGFGVVYKGIIGRDKTAVAVKKITCLGMQGKKEFCTEIGIIGNAHHVNLVRLKGFCAQGRQRFLVYEFMNRGSLDRSLFGNGNRPVLEWQDRMEIALGTARGLAYLHGGCEHKIIHCDVKPENILLHHDDVRMQVKISDFGLSKLLSPEQSGLFTTMRGTRGYLAPEWLTSSAISDKTDVYSYGMVVLELIRGRKNCSFQTSTRRSHNNNNNNSSSENDNSIPNPANGGPSSSSSGSLAVYFPLLALEMHEERRYSELVDLRLEGHQVVQEEVEKLVRVALCCVHEEPMLRPSMANVIGMLEGGMPLGVPRVESLSFLRFYGRRFTEASTQQGYNDLDEFMSYPLPLANTATAFNSTASGSHNSLSYMSSQQVSGPR